MIYFNIIPPFIFPRLKFHISYFPNFVILDVMTIIFMKMNYQRNIWIFVTEILFEIFSIRLYIDYQLDAPIIIYS